MRRTILFLSLMMYSIASTAAVTITLTKQTQYQTVEGMGGFAEDGAKYLSQTYTDFLHNDLGVTMIRMQIPDEFESANDNADPNVTDMTKYSTSSMTRWVNAVNGMKRFPDVRFIASVWSPPAWMKDNGMVANGGHLIPAMREELAESIIAYYRYLQQKCGVNLYAVSLQNECAFVEPYASCVYTATEYRDALKVVGARIAKEGIDLKLFGCEDMLDAITWNSYHTTIAQDSIARSYLYSWALHGYTNGINPIQSSTGATSWGRVGTLTQNTLKSRCWMTETSGFSNDWAGAMNLASNIYCAFNYGNLSAWVWWAMELKNDGERLLSATGTHTKRSLTSKNFYHWVRPGARRISCLPSATSIFANAFYHTANNQTTIVIINQGAAQEITLAGADLPVQFSKFTTSATKDCIEEGIVQGSQMIPIDASSVTTLAAGNFNLAVGIRPSPSVPAVGSQSTRTNSAICRLDGRVTLTAVKTSRKNGSALPKDRRLAPGVYFSKNGKYLTQSK